jgi:hypothetical protein
MYDLYYINRHSEIDKADYARRICFGISYQWFLCICFGITWSGIHCSCTIIIDNTDFFFKYTPFWSVLQTFPHYQQTFPHYSLCTMPCVVVTVGLAEVVNFVGDGVALKISTNSTTCLAPFLFRWLYPFKE